MSKFYELTVLYDTEASDGDIKQLENIISEHFIIGKKENEGKKRLAYPINGHEFATYVYYEILEREKSSARDLSNKLNVQDAALRYLLVQTDRPDLLNFKVNEEGEQNE